MTPRTRRLLIVLAVLAGLAGWWWFSRPQEMRLVDVRPFILPISDPYFTANADYILASRDESLSPTAMRWDGTVRWHIMLPEAVLPVTYANYSRKSNYSVSPRGRFCTALTVIGNSQRVMMWDEGRLLGSVSLPLTTRPWKGKTETVLAKTITLDNGQVFCLMRNVPGGSIILIEGGKVRAQGKLPAFPSPIKYPMTSYHFGPDGQALIAAAGNAFNFYQITINGNSLRFKLNYTAKDGSHWPVLTRDGFLITDDGAVYDRHGRISGSTGWNRNPPLIEIPTPNSAVLQVQYVPLRMGANYLGNARILDPHSGKIWKPSRPGPYKFCLSTPDGRYLLVAELRSEMTVTIVNWLWERQIIPAKLYYRDHRAYLCVYRKPGRICARVPFFDNSDDSISIWNPQTRQRLEFCAISLSADGHTLRLVGCDETKPSEIAYSVLTYKW